MKVLNPSTVPILIVLVLAGGGLPAAAAPAEQGWCPVLRGKVDATGESATLVPTRAQYRVDLLGGVALGSLDVEFRNDGDSYLTLSYSSRRPIRTDATELRIGTDGDTRPLSLQAPAPTKPSRARPGPAGGRPADATSSAGDTLALPPGESLYVTTRFNRASAFDKDRFVLSLPAVAGPCRSEWGAKRGTFVPVSVALRVVHPEPLTLAESPTHDVSVSFDGEATSVALIEPDRNGSRAFRFDHALGQVDRPMMNGYVSPEAEDGTRDVLVVLAPSIDAREESIRPKEVLFVLDTSGSMKGEKIESATRALDTCLARLSSGETFNVAEFDSSFTLLSERPREATPDNTAAAAGWLQQQVAGGGTALLPALAATFEQPHDGERHRLVVVLTDGQLSDEQGVLQFLGERLGEARLFIVGIGSNAKLDTIQRLAEFGRGTAAVVREAGELQAVVEALFAEVDSPLAWNLQLDWGGAEVLSMRPERLPDLYSARPVTVFARVRGPLPPDLVLEASTMEGDQTFLAPLPPGGAAEYPGLRAPRDVETPRARTKPGPRRR